ncbi:MAG: hypothetical protein PHR84_06640 [Candidatus Omnitrophica bacterium]|nr:hypothetical protein [Candidatus Omnitrophota bacterium]
MNLYKKKLILTLVVLFYFSGFAYAKTIYLKRSHKQYNYKRGEFASEQGVFSFKLPREKMRKAVSDFKLATGEFRFSLPK